MLESSFADGAEWVSSGLLSARLEQAALLQFRLRPRRTCATDRRDVRLQSHRSGLSVRPYHRSGLANRSSIQAGPNANRLTRVSASMCA